MRARDGGMENESKGWGSGERELGIWEWRTKPRGGGMENESKRWGSLE